MRNEIHERQYRLLNRLYGFLVGVRDRGLSAHEVDPFLCQLEDLFGISPHPMLGDSPPWRRSW